MVKLLVWMVIWIAGIALSKSLLGEAYNAFAFLMGAVTVFICIRSQAWLEKAGF